LLELWREEEEEEKEEKCKSGFLFLGPRGHYGFKFSKGPGLH